MSHLFVRLFGESAIVVACSRESQRFANESRYWQFVNVDWILDLISLLMVSGDRGRRST